MAVSPDTRDLCRAVLAPDLVELAVLALETYAGPEETWVHQAAIRLSDGRLHRLARWLNSAEREPETFRWYAGEPTDVSPESHRFAVDFINGLIDKDLSDPPAPLISVPDACQMLRGTTGNTGHSPGAPTDDEAARQQVSKPIGPKAPKLPKLRAPALAETACSWVPSCSCVRCALGWSPEARTG